jgi:plastocyanin
LRSMKPLIAALAGIAFAACSATPATPTPGRTPGPGTVDAQGFLFSPDRLTVTQGTSVRYVNGDRAEHTVTQGWNGVADPGAAFDATLTIEGSTSIAFTTAGEIRVTCRFHPTMNQVVVVTPAGGAGGQPSAPIVSSAPTAAPTAAPPSAAPATPAPASSAPPAAATTPPARPPGPYGSDEY